MLLNIDKCFRFAYLVKTTAQRIASSATSVSASAVFYFWACFGFFAALFTREFNIVYKKKCCCCCSHGYVTWMSLESPRVVWLAYEIWKFIAYTSRGPARCELSDCVCVCVLYLCVYLCVCVFAFLLGSFLMQPQKLIGLWIVICDRQQGQSGKWRG